MLKKLELYRRNDECGRGGCFGRYLLAVQLYKNDKIVDTKKTSDNIGNPFINGHAKNTFNPILGDRS